ncbi:MAG: TetR family transcriptional regulator [Propionibacteriaceae bacterium]|nr:TetR family transcriptional regulator [Propionibacteriaceae bacterium]
MNLSRDIIVRTAMNLLDTYGFPDLSMRRIATTLSVQPSALYWHVESKQDLCRGMAEVILNDLPTFPGELDRIPAWVARFHSLLTHHRHGSELIWSVLSLQQWDQSLGLQVEQGLREAGIPDVHALSAARGLIHLILGHCFDDDQRHQGQQLGATPTIFPDSSLGLDDATSIFLAGLKTLR